MERSERSWATSKPHWAIYCSMTRPAYARLAKRPPDTCGCSRQHCSGLSPGQARRTPIRPYGTALPKPADSKSRAKQTFTPASPARRRHQPCLTGWATGWSRWMDTGMAARPGTVPGSRCRRVCGCAVRRRLRGLGRTAATPAQPVVMTDTLTAGRFDIAFLRLRYWLARYQQPMMHRLPCVHTVSKTHKGDHGI